MEVAEHQRYDGRNFVHYSFCEKGTAEQLKYRIFRGCKDLPKTIKEEMRVRWSETDAAGIVHFTSFFVYFEVAEQKLFRDVLKSNFQNRFGQNTIIGLSRVEANCQYFSPARFDDLLEVELKVSAIGRTSITYEFSVQNKSSNKLSAIGRVKVVAINENFQPVEIPKEIAELLR